jgi:hypothetical protein
MKKRREELKKEHLPRVGSIIESISTRGNRIWRDDVLKPDMEGRCIGRTILNRGKGERCLKLSCKADTMPVMDFLDFTGAIELLQGCHMWQLELVFYLQR